MTDSHKNITVLHTVVYMFWATYLHDSLKNKIKSKHLDDKLCNKNIKITSFVLMYVSLHACIIWILF